VSYRPLRRQELCLTLAKNTMLLIYAVAAPLVILPIISIITIRSWWDWHNSVLGRKWAIIRGYPRLRCSPVILSLSLTGAVSQVVKVLVGRPRPDLIARCMPPAGITNKPMYGLVTSAICTQTGKFIMRDGFRSFPSAHSSRKQFFSINGSFGKVLTT
jgi:diacylglycerol diphosphate phosphatase/phosphatidate phosphatase